MKSGRRALWPTTGAQVVDLDASGVTEIAGGFLGGCAIGRDQALLCWGIPDEVSSRGAASSGHTTTRPGPIPKARAVAVGNQHACAIAPDGRVACWGFHGHGQLGSAAAKMENVVSAWSAVWVDGLTDVVRIAAGGTSSCAIVKDGRTLCWGSNEYGELGVGTAMKVPDPERVEGVEHVQTLVSAMSEVFALGDSGKVSSWGGHRLPGDHSVSALRPEPVALVKALFAGPAEACAISQAGAVLCRRAESLHFRADSWQEVKGASDVAGMEAAEPSWRKPDGGHSQHDQLWYVRHGSGTISAWLTTEDERLPLARIEGIEKATGLSVDLDHACAVLDGGKVRCWHNRTVVEALEAKRRSAKPRLVPVAEIDDATLASGGCLVRKSGGVWCTAMSVAGDKLELRKIASHEDVIMIRTQLGTACLLRAGGKLECGSSYAEGPADPPLEGVLSVAPGSGHTCALMTDRTVRCWGDNSSGAVGKATLNKSPTPREVLAAAE